MDRLLGRLLRFHLRIDGQGRLTDVGRSLDGLLGGRIGDPLYDLLDIEAGSGLASEDRETWPAGVVLLRFAEPDFGLRGEFVADPDIDGGLIFAGSLDPRDADRLSDLGLSASDFPAFDLTMDFAMLRWSKETQVAETKRTMERLRRSVAERDTLRVKADTDELTGVAHRAKFIAELDRALEERSDGGADRPLVLLVVDIDRFKSINDLHGHESADNLLIAVADHLRAVVGGEGLIGRIGGDEFAVLLTLDEGTADDAEQAGWRLAQAVVEFNRRSRAGGPSSVAASVSVGVAARRGEIDSGEHLRHADIAVQAARQGLTGAIGFFDPGAQRDLDLRRSITDDLEAALGGRAIKLHFQPIVDLESRLGSGFEVLSRWVHPVHGFVSPDLFVEVAERCGLISELDRYVVSEAVSLATEHLRHDGELARLSVNFSALSLTEDLPDHLDRLLSDTGYPARKLCIEVTETSSIADLGRTSEVLHELAEIGMAISLDDFGTGFSSLTYLHQLPIGLLKIDRSFVNDMLDSRKAFEVVRSIVGVARSLDLPVVAEGIEKIEQSIMLQNLGCTFGQGYFFARPGPVEDASLTVGRRLPLPPSGTGDSRSSEAVVRPSQPQGPTSP